MISLLSVNVMWLQNYASDTEYLLDLVTNDDVITAASCIQGPSTAIMYDVSGKDKISFILCNRLTHQAMELYKI